MHRGTTSDCIQNINNKTTTHYTLHTMDITLLLLLAVLVFLFTLFCAVKAITEQRKAHAQYLNNIDAHHAARTVELNALLAMIDEDKRNGLL